MEKKIVKIIGYCSKYVDGQGWTTEVPLSVLENIVELAKQEKPKKLLGYCERCGAEIYEDYKYHRHDDVYFCEYCCTEGD
jgi:hypothetical protein